MTKHRRCPLASLLAAFALITGPALASETVTHPFFGITHIDRTESTPRPLRMHVVMIDLDEPSLGFLVTPQSGPRDTTSQTTLQFLAARAAQIAINAHFFSPWPADGTGYSWLIGLAASAATSGPNGHAYAPFESNLGYPYQDNLPALNIGADNVATVVYQAGGDLTGYATDPPVTLYNAVCGNEQILTDGLITAGTGSWDETLNPRTIIGVGPENTLVLFVLDGRQPGVSEGMTTSEAAALLRDDYGVTEAINLDGGGSTTLAMADPAPRVVNVPVGTGTPGSQRSVGSNLGVFARSCSPETEGARCGDDGDPCNGEHVCRSGACVEDTEVTAVELVPLSVSGTYRARDIADNDYAPRFYTQQGDPDYKASDYGQAAVTVSFERSGAFFEGTLDASGLKPNFAYQVKLVGMPTAEYGAAGDDASNDRIGFAGRWYKVGVGNATDAQVLACRANPECDDIYEGYLVFDFFVTDRYGRATHRFVADDSFHVLWRDCPPARPMTGCQAPAGRPTVYQDVVALASTGYGYDRDYSTWTIGVFGEVERTAPQSYLPEGEYRARFILTEESFHESGTPGGYWASVIGEGGIHFWIDQPAGARDCGDGDVCDGYELCDAEGICRAGTAGVCDDGDPCTDDVCNTESGCSRTFNAGPCDDADACTSNDTCDAGACLPGEASCAVSGAVFYYRSSSDAPAEPSAKQVPNVEIDTTGDAVAEATTDSDGAYSLGGLAGEVTIRALPKMGSPRASDENGAVTSYDAALIGQASVGSIVLSPNQVIAADVSGAAGVTAYDAALVARYAVQLDNHFPVAFNNGSDWRFQRCDAYPACQDPVFHHTPLTGSTTDDFYAVLYGDVSGNWSGAPASDAAHVAGPEELAAARDRTRAAEPSERPPPLRRSGAATLRVSHWSRPTGIGGRYRALISIDHADGILGIDFELVCDPSRVSILRVDPVGLAAGYSLVTDDEGGRFSGALFGVRPLTGSGELLAVTYETDGAVMGPPFAIRAQANEGQIALQLGVGLRAR